MNATREIDLDTLQGWIATDRPMLLLDVLSADDHAAWRIPGSRNACIYEVAFPEHVAALDVDKTVSVVAYDSGPAFHAAMDACARLTELGFEDVYCFRGGRAAWSDAGLAAEGSAAGAPWQSGGAAVPATGRYALDLAKSVVFWHGRNAANGHQGRVHFAEGTIDVADGVLVAGSATVDMTSIVCDDLDGEMGQGLLRHLATGDFFLIDRHPTASFTLEQVRPIDSATPGRANVHVEGTLTVRGTPRVVQFPATFARAGDDGVALQGSFDLDRTPFGSRYGSGRLYDRLGMHLVNDEVSLQVRLVGQRALVDGPRDQAP